MEFKQNNLFQAWLISTALFLLILITVGGLTRLTGSGLSITKWQVFSGIIPPLTEATWNKYFDLYKKIPEYKLENFHITLNEFKYIFWWEYIHRLLARIIVFLFAIPFFYFLFKNKILKQNKIYFFLILILFFFQGFIGWYMVKSGLTEKTDVSHFRLATHLMIAIFIYLMLFWALINSHNQNFNFYISKKNILIVVLISLILLQMIWGAFTSGLKAGLLYQTWPLMNDHFIPSNFKITELLSYNIIAEPGYVQFIHRLLAYLIFFYFIFLFFKLIKIPKYKNILYLISFFLFLQIILGILTLISGLNIFLASMHQICSIILISNVFYLLYLSKKIGKVN